jgi:hypothetical protein
VAACVSGRRSTAAIALEQIARQRPFGIGQVGVHVAYAIGTAMSAAAHA